MFVDFLYTDVSSLFPHLVMFTPTKGSSILLGYFHSEVQVLLTSVPFIKKNVGFVEVWHDCESIIHVPFIEGGKLVSLF